MTSALREALEAARDGGRRIFVPYVTGGLDGVDAAFLRALADTGANALEVGIPFSDPVMDGPVIQEASARALRSGANTRTTLELVRAADIAIPPVVMTYLNPILALGAERFLGLAAEAGARGVIVPDLPVDEATDWLAACRAHAIAAVMLAAPNSSPERLRRVADASDGFVYCVASLGVTGRRERLAGSAEDVVAGLRRLTGIPLLAGVGISTPEQAAAACRFADGVVVGSALVEPLLRGRPEEALDRARAFRAATAA